MPWVTSSPKNSAMMIAGAMAAAANRSTNRRCRRTAALRARGPNSLITRQAAVPARARIRIRLADSTIRIARLGALTGWAPGAPAVRKADTAVIAAARVKATLKR